MVDTFTARHHGICPTCEGYGGPRSPDPCEWSETCPGVCPKCWCPGCQDGHLDGIDLTGIDPPEGDWPGSYEAYRAVQRHKRKPKALAKPPVDQTVLLPVNGETTNE